MNGHASPRDVLITNGTGPAIVPKTTKAVLETGTPSGPQARSVAGVYVEASGQAQSLYNAMKQGLQQSHWGARGPCPGSAAPRV